MIVIDGDIDRGSPPTSVENEGAPLRPFSLVRVFTSLAALAAFWAGAVHALGRFPRVTWTTSITFAVLSALFAALAVRARRGPPPLLWTQLVLASMLMAVPAHFFGPNSGFAAVVGLLIILVSLLARSENASVPPFAALVVYLVIAAGQALAVALPLAGVIADRSLLVVDIPGHPVWHHVAAHLSVQGVYLAAFLLGGALRRRYLALASEVEVGLRASERRRAMVAEARLDYHRALAAARAGTVETPPSSTVAGDSTDVTVKTNAAGGPMALLVTGLETPPARVSSAVDADAVATTSTQLIPIEAPGDQPSAYWQSAYRDKLRTTTWGLTAVCVGGVALFVVIIRDGSALVVGLAGLVGIMVSAWVHQLGLRGQPLVSWPWVLAAVFSTAAGYAIGYNSAFACFVALFMFSSGLFESGEADSSLVSRAAVPIAACSATAFIIVLILVGVVPDRSNVMVRQPGAPLAETIVLHGLLLSTYVIAFAIGSAIDRRYDALARRAHEAARDAAQQAVLYSDARDEISRLHGEGLFSSLQLGDYVIGELLGRGGMGEVYAATQVTTQRPAALKVLRFDRVSVRGHIELFRREADALCQVSSPHVAEVIEVGDFDNGLPFIAMEFIGGDGLASLLGDDRRLEIKMVRAMVADIGAGLATVHRASILHRDIKPANIILTAGDPDSRWKLVDFGVSSLGGTDSGPPRQIFGTPRYMSPEQAAGAPLDARSDLYSLSLVVYRALTGVVALTGTSPEDVSREIRETGIRDPRAFAPLADDVGLVLRLGLASEREHRLASADELRDAFEDAFAGHLDDDVRQRGVAQLAREPWR